jgi:ABC-type polysaccharide/polyol phosphate export permease
VDLYRRAFTLHAAPQAGSIVYLTVFCCLAAAAGAALFARARPHFADLI